MFLHASRRVCKPQFQGSNGTLELQATVFTFFKLINQVSLHSPESLASQMSFTGRSSEPQMTLKMSLGSCTGRCRVSNRVSRLQGTFRWHHNSLQTVRARFSLFFSRIFNQFVGLLVCWCVGVLVCWFAGWLFGRSEGGSESKTA